LLVLVPSYKQPDWRTQGLMMLLRSRGAEICSSMHCSDPALHRVIIAGRAMQDYLGEGTPFRYVLWLDDDMAFSLAGVHMLREVSRRIGRPVSAAYCLRGRPNQLAWKRLPVDVATEDSVVIWGTSPDGATEGPTALVPLYPILSGMGSLMVPAGQFRDHWRSCLKVGERLDGTIDYPTHMAAICSSTLQPNRDGVYVWVSEDHAYCEGLWEMHFGVWGVPIVFHHVSELPLAPIPEALWLDELVELGKAGG